MKTQAVVIGAGPAGASAAIGLLRAGIGVTLLEQHAEATPRLCGTFLNGEALRHLTWLGIEEPEIKLGAAVVPVVRVTTERGADRSLPLRPWGATLPRPDLERALLEGATQAGAYVRRGVRAAGYTRTEKGWLVSLAGSREALCADVLVVAHGRPTGSLGGKGRNGWYGWTASFLRVRQEPGEISLHFYPGGYVGVQTVADERSTVCGVHQATEGFADGESIFMAARSKSAAFDTLMAGTRRETPWQVGGPLAFSRGIKKSEGPLYAGDAAASGAPFLGEGLGRALGAGPMIFTALTVAQGLSGLRPAYEKLWRKAYGRRLWMGSALHFLLNSSSLTSPLLTRVLSRSDWARRLPPLFHGGFS